MARTTDEIKNRVESLADQVARSLNVEIMEVELKGSGSQRFLRITIDKEGSELKGAGVTHQECEELSRRLSELLDQEDAVPGEQPYTLEVSSPGVERKLLTLRDFQRFQGQDAKVRLTGPVDGQRTWIGTLGGVVDGRIRLTAEVGGKAVTVEFGLDQVSQANLKFAW